MGAGTKFAVLFKNSIGLCLYAVINEIQRSCSYTELQVNEHYFFILMAALYGQLYNFMKSHEIG